jgi:pyruvate, orthophosphate dikinase
MSQVVSIAAAASGDRAMLGNKGAGLARMAASGLRVPPGFVVTTDACRAYLASGRLTDELWTDVEEALAELERERDLRLGDVDAPLLVSVRSGAPVSMPGMMDTVLDLGVSAGTVEGLARRCGTLFALDTHRRFLESFGSVVLGIDHRRLEAAGGNHTDEASLRRSVGALEALVAAEAGAELLADPRRQLRAAVEAVFRSWNSPRAQAYRALRNIAEDLSTAVVVQSMVFGNLDDSSGTGVLFTRNPNTGERELYGDVLFRAQGEDVVSGRHATLPIHALRDRAPGVWKELTSAAAVLENDVREMLDIEFTIEAGQLYVLQMRSGKRAAAAAVRIALEMAEEGLIDRAEAVRRVSVEQLQRLDRPHLDPTGDHEVAARGLGASPGVATGLVCLSADRVDEMSERGEGVVLVRAETDPADVHGMAIADGILTSRGGLVSHAAVVARDLGVPAVVGVADLVVDEEAGTAVLGRTALAEGDLVTLDGSTGEVVVGRADVVDPVPCSAAGSLLEWADAITGGGTGTPAERLTAAHRALAVQPV